MTESKVLQLKFKTSSGKSATVTIANPRENLLYLAVQRKEGPADVGPSFLILPIHPIEVFNGLRGKLDIGLPHCIRS